MKKTYAYGTAALVIGVVVLLFAFQNCGKLASKSTLVSGISNPDAVKALGLAPIESASEDEGVLVKDVTLIKNLMAVYDPNNSYIDVQFEITYEFPTSSVPNSKYPTEDAKCWSRYQPFLHHSNDLSFEPSDSLFSFISEAYVEEHGNMFGYGLGSPVIERKKCQKDSTNTKYQVTQKMSLYHMLTKTERDRVFRYSLKKVPSITNSFDNDKQKYKLSFEISHQGRDNSKYYRNAYFRVEPIPVYIDNELPRLPQPTNIVFDPVQKTVTWDDGNNSTDNYYLVKAFTNSGGSLREVSVGKWLEAGAPHLININTAKAPYLTITTSEPVMIGIVASKTGFTDSYRAYSPIFTPPQIEKLQTPGGFPEYIDSKTISWVHVPVRPGAESTRTYNWELFKKESSGSLTLVQSNLTPYNYVVLMNEPSQGGYYVFRLRAEADLYLPSDTAVFEFQYLNYSPVVTPAHVSYNDDTSTLYWDAQSVTSGEVSYAVTIITYNGSSTPTTVGTFTTNDSWYTFSQLTPGMIYHAQVVAINGNKQSNPSNVYSFTYKSKSAIYTVNPDQNDCRNLTATIDGNIHVPAGSRYDVSVQSFVQGVQDDHPIKLVTCRTGQSNADGVASCNLTNIYSESSDSQHGELKYRMSVRIGEQSISISNEYFQYPVACSTTGNPTPLSAPTHLAFNATTATASWDPIPPTGTRYYFVMYSGTNGSGTILKSEYTHDTENWRSFGGLTHGASYSMKIKAVSPTTQFTDSDYSEFLNFVGP